VSNRKGEVYAVDLERGKRLGQATFGETIEGTPVFQSGTIYVPVGWGRSAIFAYDVLRGERKWRVKGSPVNTGLLLFEGQVIAADDHGRVTAYATDSGKINWRFELGDKLGVKSTPALVGDRLFVADDAGHVSAVSAADGHLIWMAETSFPSYVSLAADEEYVYVPTTRGRFIALSAADGHIVWSYDAGDDTVQLSAAAVGRKEIIFGGSDGLVRSLRREDGVPLWTTDAHAAVSATPLITESTVYVGTMRSRLLALSLRNGTISWETKLDGRIKSAFALKNGRLVVLAEPRTVYAFEQEVESYASQEK
jgi:outer membrane protein assembly factor BamB